MAQPKSLIDICHHSASQILAHASSENHADLPRGRGVLQLLQKLASDATNTGAPPNFAASIHRAEDLIRLANQKLHAYPFRDVPLCWRRLYTDASILKSIFQIYALIESSNEDVDADVEVVKTLDMALIMTGAPGEGQREAIDELLEGLQTHFVPESEGPVSKRRKLEKGGEGSEADAVKISHGIPRTNALSIEAFQSHLDHTNTPLVLTNTLSHFPALTSRPWKSLDYLLSRTNNGKRLVPVEVGRSYTDEGWGQKIITFREFLERYILRNAEEGTGYLAQHDLFAQIPSLRNDILIPDYCYTSPPPPPENVQKTGPLDEPILNAWFGPRGTISPLHTDPYHNVLCQIVGSKYVRLYPPEETEKVYPRGIEGGGIDMSNTSEVDVEGAPEDLERFPKLKEARYLETVLAEGEALFIPAGWWHYIRSLEVSFSVSYWWN